MLDVTKMQTGTEPIVTGSRHCDPLTDPRWRHLAADHGDLFNSPRWMSVLHQGYGLDFGAMVFGQDRGGFAWSKISDVRGTRFTSLPFSDFADPPGLPSPSDMSDAIGPLLETGWPVTLRLLRSQTPELPGLDEVDRLAWHRATLPATEEELWTSVKSGARQNVRKAQKHGVVVTVGSSHEMLRAFRRLHVSLRKSKYRMLAQPTAFFDAIADRFGPDDLRVVLASDDGEVVAGVVLLRHGDTGYYKFNASTDRALAIRANDLVMWTSMLEAQQWGCRHFDFGVSDHDQPGLIRYKRKYATEEAEVVVLKAAGARQPGRVSSSFSRSLPKLTNLLTDERCPDRLTAWGGDALYRLFC